MASSSAAASMVKATLGIYEPPTGTSTSLGGKIADVDFQYNPSQLTLSKSATWTTQHAPKNRDAATPQFNGADPYRLSLDIFLDTSMTPGKNTVQKGVESLLSCCEVTSASIAAQQPRPPCVLFQWGSFSTVSFIAYIERITATYSMFSPSGTPIRAKCSLEIVEIPSMTKGQNPTSGALEASRSHRVMAGDTLASLAWSEYGDATVWRAIAEANDIDDPMRLDPGTELLIPASSESPGASGYSGPDGAGGRS